MSSTNNRGTCVSCGNEGTIPWGPYPETYYCYDCWSPPKRDKKGNANARVIRTVQVAHVIFTVEEGMYAEPDTYDLYSESPKEGKQLLGVYLSNERVSQVLDNEIRKLEDILEQKRKGWPTPKQLHFLFREKIPIPLDLTWGQASDLIDERLAQIEYEKAANRLKRFDGLTEGEKVSYLGQPGTITKLTQAGGRKYAHLQLDSGTTIRTTIEDLKNQPKCYAGAKVSHQEFGPGVVMHAGTALAKVQFQGDKKMVKVADLTAIEE